MRKIYLVKKNPELPADGNNWIVMNGYEFAMFMQTPEGQKRKDNFGQLDACTMDDVIIVAECGVDTAKKWRSEKDEHDYLASLEETSNFTVFSYSTQTTTEDELSGEELLVDEDANVEKNVFDKLDRQELLNAINQLTPYDCALITCLFLKDNPMTEEQFSAISHTPRRTVNYHKHRALLRLKKMLRF